MKKVLYFLSFLLFIVLGGFFAWNWFVSSVEQPKYEVLANDSLIEIRRYSPMIVAEVDVEGERDEAIRKGFRLLAEYIFGNNTKNHKVAMTAPVKQQESQKISMTSPVRQQEAENKWAVQFVMPSEYSFEQLPIPNNDKVKLKKVPSKELAVITFSGRNTTENIKKHEQKISAYLKQKNLTAISNPYYAFYNPPWTLPFMRRNEVMIEIKN